MNVEILINSRHFGLNLLSSCFLPTLLFIGVKSISILPSVHNSLTFLDLWIAALSITRTLYYGRHKLFIKSTKQFVLQLPFMNCLSRRRSDVIATIADFVMFGFSWRIINLSPFRHHPQTWIPFLPNETSSVKIIVLPSARYWFRNFMNLINLNLILLRLCIKVSFFTRLFQLVQNNSYQFLLCSAPFGHHVHLV